MGKIRNRKYLINFKQYKNGFKTVSFEDILNIMGIDLLELDKLKN